MEKITKLSYELHEKLILSNEYKNLKSIEKKMLENATCKLLLEKFHHLQEVYATNKSNEILSKLHYAKLKLDENELVKEYKKAYKDYQILIGNITDIVFDGFAKKSIIDKIIRAK